MLTDIDKLILKKYEQIDILKKAKKIIENNNQLFISDTIKTIEDQIKEIKKVVNE